MKKSVSSALYLLLMLLSFSAYSGDPIQVQDPIFGIYYDPNVVHFDKAKNTIIVPCKNDLKGLEKVTIYASWKNSEHKYFIVSGLVRNKETHYKYESGTSLVLKINGDSCQSAAGDFFLAGENSPTFGQGNHKNSFDLEDVAVEGITSNILETYSRAFGSKEKFLKALTYSHFNFNPDPILNPMPPLLRSKLKSFCPVCFKKS